MSAVFLSNRHDGIPLIVQMETGVSRQLVDQKYEKFLQDAKDGPQGVCLVDGCEFQYLEIMPDVLVVNEKRSLSFFLLLKKKKGCMPENKEF